MKEDERREILDMIASGKISAEEASRMLSGVEVSKSGPDQPIQVKMLKEQENEVPETVLDTVLDKEGGSPRWFHVHVSDLDTGKNKVKVNIPLGLVKFGLAIGSRFTSEVSGLDLDEISGFVTSNKGLLVDVQDDEDGERVQIFVD
jgi:hypothetical protein